MTTQMIIEMINTFGKDMYLIEALKKYLENKKECEAIC